MTQFVDTHCHIDGDEFCDDRAEVMARAREAGVSKVLVPAIDLHTSQRIIDLCSQHEGYLYAMVGLHPEEVHTDWKEQLRYIKELLTAETNGCTETNAANGAEETNCFSETGGCSTHSKVIAIGEVGLDFYWSREFEQEQLEAFEEQVRWSVKTRLPLMIHCRKAQNELVTILKRYARELPGGVFHCFTGNEIEARELLQFERFVLGIGGVLTFKKSHLPEVLPAVVPLDRIVLETDAPYMAPVPMRGKRNEPAFTRYVLQRLAEAFHITEDTVAAATNMNVQRVFGI